MKLTVVAEYPTKPPKCKPIHLQRAHNINAIRLTTIQVNSPRRFSTRTSTHPVPSASRSSTKKKPGSRPLPSSRSFSAFKCYLTKSIQSHLHRLRRTTSSRKIALRMRRLCGRSSRTTRHLDLCVFDQVPFMSNQNDSIWYVWETRGSVCFIISVAYGEMDLHVAACGCSMQGYAMDTCDTQHHRKIVHTALKILSIIRCFNIKECPQTISEITCLHQKPVPKKRHARRKSKQRI
jgi:hypothetical protein